MRITSISPLAPTPTWDRRSSGCASPWACWRCSAAGWCWACAPSTRRPKKRAPPNRACRSKIDAIKRERQGYQEMMRQPPTRNCSPGRHAQPALRRKDLLLDAGDGRSGNRFAGRSAGDQPRALARPKDRPHHPEAARGWTARPRRRSGREPGTLEALSAASHRERMLRVHGRAQRAAGAGERLEPLQLRAAGRIQPGGAGRAQGGKKAGRKREARGGRRKANGCG